MRYVRIFCRENEARRVGVAPLDWYFQGKGGQIEDRKWFRG